MKPNLRILCLALLLLVCIPLCAHALEGEKGREILLEPNLVPAPYDAYPALGVYTEIDPEQDAEGNYNATIRVTHRCFGDAAADAFPPAEDIEIEVIAMDGLQLLSGVDSATYAAHFGRRMCWGGTAA